MREAHSGSIPNDETPGMSRRDFLKLGGVAATAAALGGGYRAIGKRGEPAKDDFQERSVTSLPLAIEFQGNQIQVNALFGKINGKQLTPPKYANRESSAQHMVGDLLKTEGALRLVTLAPNNEYAGVGLFPGVVPLYSGADLIGRTDQITETIDTSRPENHNLQLFGVRVAAPVTPIAPMEVNPEGVFDTSSGKLRETYLVFAKGFSSDQHNRTVIRAIGYTATTGAMNIVN